MKIVAAAVISVLIILFSFQNCQKPPHADEISGQQQLSSSAKVDLNQEVVTGLNLIIQDYQVVTKANHSYQVMYNKTLSVNLSSGVIHESSDLDSATADYCLTEDLKAELNSIVKSSQVCHQEKISAGPCAQAAVPPYAQLFTDKEQFDLGSASDSCGTNAVDLCGDQSSMLKGYIQALKKNYQQLGCQ